MLGLSLLERKGEKTEGENQDLSDTLSGFPTNFHIPLLTQKHVQHFSEIRLGC